MQQRAFIPHASACLCSARSSVPFFCMKQRDFVLTFFDLEFGVKVVKEGGGAPELDRVVEGGRGAVGVLEHLVRPPFSANH